MKKFIKPNQWTARGHFCAQVVFAVYALTLCLQPALADEDTCTIDLGGVPIKYEAIRSLHRALQDDYTAEILVKNVNGENRVLVVMGETHIKTESSSLIGKEVLENFENLGLEGSDATLSIGGKAKARLKEMFLKMGIKPLREFALMRFLQKNLTEKSTAYEPAYAEIRKSFYNTIVDTFSAMSDEDLKKKWESMKETSSAKKNESIELYGVSIMKVKELHTILDEVYLARFKGEPAPVKVESDQKTRKFMLELGRKAGLAENLNSIGVNAVSGFLLLSLLSGYFHSTALNSAFYGVTAYTWADFAINYFTKNSLSREAWYQALFPLRVAQWNSRNDIMVANIQKAFDETPDMNNLLVIVGKNHVMDMKKMLIKDQGFVSIPLPSENQLVQASHAINSEDE
jgi:hypothetical protein